MSSLFDELEAESAATTGRKVHTMEPAQEEVSFPKVQSLDQFESIWIAMLKDEEQPVHFPDEDTIARMRKSGWKSPGLNGWHDRAEGVDCHRWEFERLSFPVEDVIGKKHVIQLKATVVMALSQRTSGTKHNLLMSSHATNNGVWVPVEIAFKRAHKPFLDGIRPANFRNPSQEGDVRAVTADDIGHIKGVQAPGWTEAVNVRKETIDIVIRWADIRNAPHARLDSHGNAVADMTLRMPSTPASTDPALLAILQKLTAPNIPGDAPEEEAPPKQEAPKTDGPKKWAPKVDPTEGG